MTAKKKWPKWLLNLYIPGGIALLIALVNGAFGLFGHHTSPSISNAVAGTNFNRSMAVAGNQTGNNTTDDHSTTVPQTISVGQNQAPFYAPQNTTVNNYYGTVSNSVTKDAFDALENTLSTATNKIELTVNEVHLLAQALRDLDQRTADIEKLPDGRTKFGSMVSGEPKAIIKAFDSGVQHYNNKEYGAALPYFMKAIEIVESEPKLANLIIGGGDITPKGKGQFYYLAANSASMLHSNSMASAFAEKAVASNPNAENNLLLASASASLGEESMKKEDYAAALELFCKAINAYQAGRSTEDFQITNVHLNVVAEVYGTAAQVAQRLGSNNLAYAFATNFANLAPTDIRSQLILASTLGKIGRKEDAVTLIDKAFGPESNNPAAIRYKEIIRAEH